MAFARMKPLAVMLMGLVVASAVSSECPASSGPHVVEVTIAAPDVIGVIIHDPPYVRGKLVKTGPTGKQHGQWARHDGQWGRVVGLNHDHIRTFDTAPSSYLDRDAIDDAEAYAKISGLSVEAVYRKSVPYDSGTSHTLFGRAVDGASFKHYVYLKMSAALPTGTHRIVWPGDALPAHDFEYRDTATRAIALHINQNGYAPGDTAKSAFLSLWLPGGPDNGQVDFRRYGFKTFEVRDDAGKTVYNGPIKLRRTASDPELGTGLPGTLIGYPSVSVPPRKAEALAFEPGGVLTVPGHGLPQDDKGAWFEGFSGPLGHLNGVHRIAVTDKDRFALSEVTEKIEGDWGSGNLGSVRPFFLTNRAGTFVFELDFSAWKPASPDGKQYRIHVPGLGVSDPFEVSKNVWLRAAQTAVGGLYNHRSGIALDGRFGFTRPEAFGPNADFDLIQSKLPIVFTSNYHLSSIPIATGVLPEWQKAEPAEPGLWGGYMDAGDWDRRIQHLEASKVLMDVFEFGGTAAQQAELSLPPSHEVLDPSLYRSLSGAPDLVHEIAWGVDFFRRLQLPDGKVRGGIESAEHPKSAEPSFLESQPVYVNAPDHVSGFAYASAAAKFAGILKSLGNTDLSDLFKDSALRAWSAAEAGFKDPDSFYAEAIETALASKLLSEADWKSLRAKMQESADTYRIAAAGELFRLTGEQPFADVFETGWPKHGVVAPAGDGAWAYYHAAEGKAEIKKAIKAAYGRQVRIVLNGLESAAYPSLKHPAAPAGWGQGGAPQYNLLQLMLRGHVLSGDQKILDALLLGSAHILGANPVNVSFTTGLGLRNVRHPLHEDHRAMGVDAPKGITIFGWAPQSMTNYHWLFGDGGALSDFGAPEARIEPFRYGLPFYEYLVEYPEVIVQQEYTIHQTIGTTAAMWLYLHARTSQPNPP